LVDHDVDATPIGGLNMVGIRARINAMTNDRRNWGGRRGGGDAVYGLGIIGALVYYIGHASGFWSGVLGILKALVWPAFVVYELLGHLHG
jgi:hypothetical protein